MIGPSHAASGRHHPSSRLGISRRSFLKAASASGATAVIATATPALAGGTATENARAGSPPSTWESDRHSSIVGFTTRYSAFPGETVHFKVLTDAAQWRIRVFRLGWYGGAGARWLGDVTPSVPLPQTQPAPLTDPASGLVDCGNWAVSASWTVPANAVSGIYYALLERLDNGLTNHVVFVVRSTAPTGILVQTSETTQHAYNRYGGNSLYFGDPAGRAYKVSYNRPFDAGDGEENDFFNAEIALVRFLERNGYDVAYCGGIDVHQDPNALVGAKVFISSGHDEYVSGAQRAAVAAARDRGTHLIFMTGNEYFWRVRFEPSIDAGGAADRTLVCYKETLANAKIDPSPEWTGTWRDPRFTASPNGGYPENELTGQLFRAILPVASPDLQIEVPGEFAKHRMWRHTPIAALGAHQRRTLGENTLGYEFDVDADNGHRPPGVIRLSETTATVPQLLLDHGSTYAPGTCVHSMTMYRAASGALVWGLGTVQWSYGLDSYHMADPGSATDPAIAQATVNVLADMGAQPATLESGLVPVSASADVIPPVVAITSPAGPITVPIGTPVAISGTATDSGGGVVASVEVSVDGGARWHPAVGRTAWSYVVQPMQLGEQPVLVRAVDDSCNIGEPSSLLVTGGQRGYPCTIWPEGTVPQVTSTDDATPIEIGVRFRMTEDGFVRGIRFYKGSGNGGTHVGSLWTNAGHLLAQATFTAETASGWQTASIEPVPISAGVTYVASVFLPQGHYAADTGYFATAFDLPPLTALASGDDGPNGVYLYGAPGFPGSTFGATNYWVDIVASNDDERAPTVVAMSPSNGLQAVALDAPVSATFSEGMQADSIVLSLTGGDGSSTGGAASYDAPSRTITFVPSQPFTAGTTYTARIEAAQDRSGSPLPGPLEWTFQTAADDGFSPATLWTSAARPASILAESSPVELGTRFVPRADGEITALRFYRAPGSEGPHVGHLWSADGALLGTAAFAAAGGPGWQQAALEPPVPVQQDTPYTVSYHAPHGGYAATPGYFHGSSVVRELISAPESAAVAGNGVFRYGASGYPTASWGATCYWADVALTLPPDTAAPVLVDHSPAAGVDAVDPATAVSAVFSETMNAVEATVTAGTSGAAVPVNVSYDSASRTATITPSTPWARGTTHTVTITGSDRAGNALDPYAWAFTTVSSPGRTPATLWTSLDGPGAQSENDAAAIEVGVRVTPQSSGFITALRFYKGPGNDGPHVGHLWAADGTLLGSTSFAAESGSGWQQSGLPQPVPVTAGQPYVASYHAPHGHYSATATGLSTSVVRTPLLAPGSSHDGPNGLFVYGSGGFPTGSYRASNYWVDVVFVDSAGPAVISQSPLPSATDVAIDALVAVGLSEPIDAATAQLRVQDSAGAPVAGQVDYDAATVTLTFTPSGQYVPGASYTATLQAADDLAGNALGAPVSWTFTTVGAGAVSLWSSNVVPQVIDSGDDSAIEVGLRFRSDAAGAVTAIRFYKGGSSNAGPHQVSLWSDDGSLLATATATSETARGWQVVRLPSPVGISAGQTYVVSYLAASGHYSVDYDYFASGDHVAAPLTAPGPASGQANGVFSYGGGFPQSSYRSSNYWVDVQLEPES